jgi:hypothetical protein
MPVGNFQETGFYQCKDVKNIKSKERVSDLGLKVDVKKRIKS